MVLLARAARTESRYDGAVVLRPAALWLPFLALPWSVGCAATESFVCNADAQCVVDGSAGRCEPEGVCSFPDEGCPSGHRYGLLAGELSGECVEVGSSDASTDPGTSAVVPGGTAETGDGSSGPTATSTSTTGSTTTSMTSTSSTTEPEPETTGITNTDPYGPCTADRDCAVAGSLCIPAPSGSSVCSPPCDVEPCTYEGMAAATPACLPVTRNFQGCILLCDAPDECPGGMTCEEIVKAGIGYCVWPAP